MREDVRPSIETSEGLMARRSRPSRIIAAVAAVAVVAVAGTVLWLKPWQSVDVPASACWGVVTKSDLEPVAGADGKMTVDSQPSLTGAFVHQGSGMCDALWNGRTDLFDTLVMPDNLDDIKQAVTSSASQASWSTQVTAISSPMGTLLYFKCDYPSSIKNGAIGQFYPYVRVQVSGSTSISTHGSIRARQAYADMALKLAKAAAQQIPCTNTVDFPARAPAVPELK